MSKQNRNGLVNPNTLVGARGEMGQGIKSTNVQAQNKSQGWEVPHAGHRQGDRRNTAWRQAANSAHPGEHFTMSRSVKSLSHTPEATIILYVKYTSIKKIPHFKCKRDSWALKFVFPLRQVHFRQGIRCEHDTPHPSPRTVAASLAYLWKGGLGTARLLDGLLVAGRVFRLGDRAPKQGVLDDALLGRRGRSRLRQTEEGACQLWAVSSEGGLITARPRHREATSQRS